MTGNAYAFTAPDSSVERVEFFIDNITAQGTANKTENHAPYDLAGGSTDTAHPFDTTQLTDGTHTLTARLTLDDGSTQLVTAAFTVVNYRAASNSGSLNSPGSATLSLLVSSFPDRSGPVSLAGATVTGNAYAFTAPDSSVERVEFFIDNITAQGTANKTENHAPYDLAGGSTDTAHPFDTTQLTDGTHTLTARLTLDDGSTQLVTAAFTVTNNNNSSSGHTGSISLSWVAPTMRTDGTALSLAEIGAYTLYYGSSEGNYTSSIDITDSTTSSLKIDDLPTGTYYFALTARDIAGIESSYSPAVQRVVSSSN